MHPRGGVVDLKTPGPALVLEHQPDIGTVIKRRGVGQGTPNIVGR
ncbi:uncharacterized protein METZ01_LOCUS46793 [marine metagenome]|uniref:Uncharacterized protein n=1 Tax=marine metagenome TaxID=408172 RepID=A0A381RS87_9ZZZZ